MAEPVELPALVVALRASGGNVARAAAILGISRQRAYRLMEGQSVDLDAMRGEPEKGAVSAGPDPSPVGKLIGGKYRIVRLLARGGMGVVYEAQHTVVRRRFAIKFLRRDLAERRDILNRFQREAEAAGALENDHVTAAIDFSISDDGTPYIVMEYLVGESLGRAAGARGPAAGRPRRRSRRAGLPRRRRRPRRRDRPPRSQAAQPVRLPPRRRDRLRQGPRLRRRQAAGPRRGERGDADGGGARDGRVHVARAGARRQDGRQAGRRLRAGRDPLRAGLPRSGRTPATRRTRSCITSRPSRRCRSPPSSRICRPTSSSSSAERSPPIRRRGPWRSRRWETRSPFSPDARSGPPRRATAPACGWGSCRRRCRRRVSRRAGTPAVPTIDDRAVHPTGPSADGHTPRSATPSAGGQVLAPETPSAGGQLSAR